MVQTGKFRAAAIAVVLVVWSFIAPRVRFHPMWNAALGAGVYALARPPLGLRPPALWSGLRYGLAVAVPIGLGVAVATAIPPVRRGMAARELPDRPVRWMALNIPIGTVWPEEVVYRATLGNAAETAFQPARGRLLQAVAFGLWHIMDARITGNPILGTVLFTGVAGWLFGWLHARSGSVVAPMLAHLAANEAAALAALAVQRRIESRS